MTNWIATHFLNPAFVLPGAALIAAPILIHLINRLRYRRVRFAAMEFLLASEQRNRKRILMEQLLLLLLRILIVLGIAALIARLVLDPEQMSLFQGAKAHHLVLLDDSASMQQRLGDETAFNKGLDVVTSLVAEGARRPDTQKFTLFRLSRPREALFTERDVNERFLTELDTKLENVRCSHQAPELLAGLDAVSEFFADDRATVRHLHIVTDFRDQDWVEQKAIADKLKQLDEAGIQVNVVRTVKESADNLAITALTSDVQVASAGVPLRFQVAVANRGQSVAENVRLVVRSDGRRMPLTVAFDKIEPGAEVTQTQDLVFEEPGQHRVSMELDLDVLATDNKRFAAFSIVDSNPVLIIDGNPDGADGQFVANALAADPRLTGFAPIVERTDYLRTQPLDRFRSICMVNVPELPADAVDPLERYVAAGGGLAWFTGARIKPLFYNAALFKGGQNGLFPVPLDSVEQLPRTDSSAADLTVGNHPMFAVLSGRDNPFIESVRIDNYHGVANSWLSSDGTENRWNPDDDARRDGVTTIASLRNKQPLIFEHRYQGTGGRVITCLTSAGPGWNNWSANPSFVISQLELQRAIAKSAGSLNTQQVGEPIDLRLPVAGYLETVEITSPESAGERVTRMDAAPAGESEADVGVLSASFRETDAPGVYRIKLLDAGQVPEQRWIAFNVSPDESTLKLADADSLQSRLADSNVRIRAAGETGWIQGGDAGQEVRNILLLLIVLALVAEQWLSYRLSYHPDAGSGAAA